MLCWPTWPTYLFIYLPVAPVFLSPFSIAPPSPQSAVPSGSPGKGIKDINTQISPRDILIPRLLTWTSCSSHSPLLLLSKPVVCIALTFVFCVYLMTVFFHGFTSCFVHFLLLTIYKLQWTFSIKFKLSGGPRVRRKESRWCRGRVFRCEIRPHLWLTAAWRQRKWCGFQIGLRYSESCYCWGRMTLTASEPRIMGYAKEAFEVLCWSLCCCSYISRLFIL